MVAPHGACRETSPIRTQIDHRKDRARTSGLPRPPSHVSSKDNPLHMRLRWECRRQLVPTTFPRRGCLPDFLTPPIDARTSTPEVFQGRSTGLCAAAVQAA
nr:hypothetical protein CFP56_52149 [Quercus suber]